MNRTAHPTLFSMVTTRASSLYTQVALKSFHETTALGPHDSFLLISNDDAPLLEYSRLLPSGEIYANSQPKSFAANMNFARQRALEKNQDLVFLNNDLVFTPDWFNLIGSERDMIISPLSNREIVYSTESFKTSVVMTLDHYLGHETELIAIAQSHRRNYHGIHRVFLVPFFAIFVPVDILQAVGQLDESYGPGGGEDYDYCLRAIQVGFNVGYARSSFILHFGGRSTYSVETEEQQISREQKFFNRFRDKWGESLYHLCLKGNYGIIPEDAELSRMIAEGNYKAALDILLSSERRAAPY